MGARARSAPPKVYTYAFNDVSCMWDGMHGADITIAIITYIHTYTNTYLLTHIHACIHTCIHTYMHTYIHTCMHTYIHDV